jgi:Spy/CpxP family protein refolding chaperone
MTRTTRTCPLVIAALFIGCLASTSGLAQSPTGPRSNQGSGESAAGKNDSSTGKGEGDRAREMQTQRPLALSQEQRTKIQDSWRAGPPKRRTASISRSLLAPQCPVKHSYLTCRAT